MRGETGRGRGGWGGADNKGVGRKNPVGGRGERKEMSTWISG